MVQEEWEIHFNLLSSEKRSESFKFLVNPMSDSRTEIPSFPKDNFLRALQSHHENSQYILYEGKLKNLKIKENNSYCSNNYHVW